MTITNPVDRHGDSLWSILSEHGKKAVIINDPITYPPEKVNGAMISGLLAPEFSPQSTFPSDLYYEIIDRIGEYQIDVKEPFAANREDAFLKDLYFTMEKRGDVALYLMEKYDWDFLMIFFTCTDRIQHFFWRYMDNKHPAYDPKKAKKFGNSIIQCYKKIDSIIGKIMEKTDEDTIFIIVSDHGFGPEHKELFINNWLMETGLLGLKKNTRALIRHQLRKHGLTKDSLINWISHSGALLIFMKSLKKHVYKIMGRKTRFTSLSLPDIDWAKTKAFGDGEWKIYINLKGRDPEGVVQPGEEYERLREQLIERLYDLRDPETDERIVSNVYKREQLYWGPYLQDAPDIVFVTKDMTYRDRPGLGRKLVDRPPIESGTHRPSGILLVKGRNTQKGVEIEDPNIIDILPTILHIMDVPIPSDVDGRVLMEIFEPGSDLANRKINYQFSPEKQEIKKYVGAREEEEEIRERLRRLGYLG